MSENIRGITFAEQAVTPADDAIVRRAMLSDGILTGCEISYSGSTLTMAAGYIIACGRSFQITTAQNWAVVDATSGVARLVLTIDLTKTATESAFNQIDFAVEYASAEDGFAGLVQEDINISGTKYQITAAVVSLGTGGITGIVSKLEKTEGGGGLNFKVVAGLDQPGSATENTIWLKIPSMTGWIIAASQPEELTEGMVWISVGTESAVEFNALKRNGIQVYPLRAKQMVGGTLVDVEAMSYQNGEWVKWVTYLYNFGDKCTDITGGWQFVSTRGGCTVGSYTDNGESITLNGSASAMQSTSYCTEDAVDLTNVTKLWINAIEASGSYLWFKVGTTVSMGNGVVRSDGCPVGPSYIDVSNLSGAYYVAIEVYSDKAKNGSLTFDQIWME